MSGYAHFAESYPLSSSFFRNERYGNQRYVFRHKTIGRGIHFLNSEDVRQRRNARRFLNWYVRRLRAKPMPIVYDSKNERTLVPGSYKPRYDWNYYFGYMVIQDGESIGFESDCGRLFWFDGYEYPSTGFQRDGMPNNYDEDADIYDNLCDRRNREAFAIKHGRHPEDWIRIRSEIIAQAKKIYGFAEELKLAKDNFEKYKNRWWCPRETSIQYDPHEFNKSVEYWKRRDMIDLSRKLSGASRPAKDNLRQLRALGFVA